MAMFTLVALVMWATKRYYADAPVDDLRWMLRPTTSVVTAVTGVKFEWQAGEGYLTRERLFLIEKACAGINFLIAAFGMTVYVFRRHVKSAASIAGVALASLAAAYAAAVIVNAARITIAIGLAAHPVRASWMTAVQMHRAEGIVCYFIGLVLLYAIGARLGRGSPEATGATLATPLVWYYAIAIVVPLMNGAGRRGGAVVEHMLFVLVLPLLIAAIVAILKRFYSARRATIGSTRVARSTGMASAIVAHPIRIAAANTSAIGSNDGRPSIALRRSRTTMTVQIAPPARPAVIQPAP
jgi:exosortase K